MIQKIEYDHWLFIFKLTFHDGYELSVDAATLIPGLSMLVEDLSDEELETAMANAKKIFIDI